MKFLTHQNGGDVGAVLVKATGARIDLKEEDSENLANLEEQDDNVNGQC